MELGLTKANVKTLLALIERLKTEDTQLTPKESLVLDSLKDVL